MHYPHHNPKSKSSKNRVRLDISLVVNRICALPQPPCPDPRQFGLSTWKPTVYLLPHEQIMVQIFYIASRLKVTPSKSIPLNIFLPICSPSVRHSHKRSESFTGVGRNQQSRYEFQVDGADSPEPPPLEILDHVRRPIIWTQISPVTCGSADCQAYGCHLFSVFPGSQ